MPSAALQRDVLLGPTCFLRCLACASIVVFHTLWYVGLGASDRGAMDAALGTTPWMTVMLNPEPPLMIFFSLTGCELLSAPPGRAA